MTSDLKADTGLPWKHDLKPANQTEMTTQPYLKDNQILNKTKWSQKTALRATLQLWKMWVSFVKHLCGKIVENK